MAPIVRTALVFSVFAGVQTASAATGARPDVLGIKVGVSSVADVRSALGAVTPVVEIEELQVQLSGITRQTQVPVQIENGKYVSQIRATTKAFRQPNTWGCPQGVEYHAAKSNCEDIAVAFSAPPDSGTAYSISRIITFVNGPSVDNLLRSLIDKYGQPGHTRNFGNRGVQYDVAWVWSVDGKPISLDERHPCSDGRAARFGSAAQYGPGKQLELTQQNLKAGCAVALHITIRASNNVVSGMRLDVLDNAGFQRALLKTSDLVTNNVKNFEQRERDSAAKTATPKL